MLLITHAHRRIAARNDYEIEPIPGVPQVGVFVDGEALGNYFDEHLDGVDGKEEELGLLERLALGEEDAVDKYRGHN